MIRATASDLIRWLDYPSLMDRLREAFNDPNMHTPKRNHYTFGQENQNSLLLMPSWSTNTYLGVKIVTICADNPAQMKPSIQGTYVLYDALDGKPLLHCDAKLLTVLRTAACSALAASYLARKDSKTMVMIGTGSLAPHLIRAHCSVRPIKKVYVWGRNFLKAAQIVDSLINLPAKVKAIEYLDEFVAKADIISTATMSSEPLVHGKWVKEGTHVDLVGSYLPTMREADDALMRKASVFVDDLEAAFKESGDLIIPGRKGILRKGQIKGSLYELCRMVKLGRATSKEITVFKSVGLALEDLAGAGLLYEKLKESEPSL
jgi:ornithine cyclodeaminase